MTDKAAQLAVSRNVARLRSQQKLSLSEAGRRAHTSAGAINDIEKNGRMPGAGLLTRLAKAFDVPIDELFKKSKKTLRSA